MRILKIATLLMAVMIVVGTVVLGVLIARKVSPTEAMRGPVVLDEPTGSHITGVSAAGANVAVALQGGGPDRLLILDPRTFKIMGRVMLRQ